MSEAGYITIGLSALAGVVWAVRIEGRVWAHDRDIQQLRADMKTEVAQVLVEVRYIRDRLDDYFEKYTS